MYTRYSCGWKQNYQEATKQGKLHHQKRGEQVTCEVSQGINLNLNIDFIMSSEQLAIIHYIPNLSTVVVCF